MIQKAGVWIRSAQYKFLLGLVVSIIVASIAAIISHHFPLMSKFGLSMLTLAIIVGIIFGNFPFGRVLAKCGVNGLNFSKQRLLRLGIILYGFRLTYADIKIVGLSGILIDAMILFTTFLLAIYLGIKKFELDKNAVILMGAGNSICGAAAILATEPLLKSSNDQTTSAISTVVLFGTLSIFLYPSIYFLIQFLIGIQLDPSLYGKYIGSTVLEVAQVVASSNLINDEVSNIAVITKMVRVMMLGPFLIFLSIYTSYDKNSRANQSLLVYKPKNYIPWFAVVFLVCIGINSVLTFSSSIKDALIFTDNFLLAMAMGALGFTTDISSLLKTNIKLFRLAIFLFCWLVIGGAIINLIVTFLVQKVF
ncbi:YeiH family protein [Polynucleobacter sinensis]|uniref:YeiH family protein n=1 Tax=Polynucleobacter sinensis TaxID=1743157 RepID=UPI0007815E4B|nr:YeiH family protein [Polynucleobacter sinensis]